MPLTPVNDYTKFSTTVLGAQFAPAICALSGGGYVIVWEDDNSGKIYAQRFGATGQPVGAELHLDSVQGGAAIWVSVAPTAGDGFVIAFQAGLENNAEIFARRYDSINNPVGGLFAVNTTSPNEQYNPHIQALDEETACACQQRGVRALDQQVPPPARFHALDRTRRRTDHRDLAPV